MGIKYPSKSISGYNATPPADDGTTVEANRTTWAKHKSKLGDPVKVLAEAINTAMVAYVAQETVDKGAAFTTTTAEHKKTINVTGAYTQSLGDASTMGASYMVTIKNSHTAAITVDLDTGADTLDGSAGGSTTVAAQQAKTFITNAAADGYHSLYADVIDTLTVNTTLVMPAGTVDTAELAADAVDSTKLADEAVDSEHYVDGSVDNVHLASGIATAKLASDNGIIAAMIAPNAVDTSEIAANAVDTSEIAAAAVGRSEIANSTTTSAGSINSLDTLNITFNDWALLPMLHGQGGDISLRASSLDGSSAAAPRLRLFNEDGGAARTYDVDHRWIITA